MGKHIVREKSFSFALLIIKLYKYMTEEKREYVLSKQALRSGTSIGALIREAEQGESKADFIHKLAISLKEAKETEYWLELLFYSDYIEEKSYQSIYADVQEIIKLLTSIIKTSKSS
jgi:four helix bundle protein